MAANRALFGIFGKSHFTSWWSSHGMKPNGCKPSNCQSQSKLAEVILRNSLILADMIPSAHQMKCVPHEDSHVNAVLPKHGEIWSDRSLNLLSKQSKLSFSNTHDNAALDPSGCPAVKSICQKVKSMDEGCSSCKGSKRIATRLCTNNPRAMRRGGKYGSDVSNISVHILTNTSHRYRAWVSCVAYRFRVSISRRLKNTAIQSHDVGMGRKECSMRNKNFSRTLICSGVIRSGSLAIYPKRWSHCAIDNA